MFRQPNYAYQHICGSGALATAILYLTFSTEGTIFDWHNAWRRRLVQRTEIFLEVSIFDWTRNTLYKLEKHAFEKFKLQAENHGFQNTSPFFVESFSSSMLNFGCKMWFISLPKIDTNDDIRRRCGLLVPSSCKISSDFTWRHPPLQVVSYGNLPQIDPKIFRSSEATSNFCTSGSDLHTCFNSNSGTALWPKTSSFYFATLGRAETCWRGCTTSGNASWWLPRLSVVSQCLGFWVCFESTVLRGPNLHQEYTSWLVNL